MTDIDLHFYFDPVCPFAWMTSTWVRTVARQRDYAVDWRFISLRLLNSHLDYDAHFPPEYEAGHTAGLKLLRVAARVRAQHGREAIGPLYAALGERIWGSEVPPSDTASRDLAESALTQLGLSSALADALEDTSGDAELRAETDQALVLTGKDVGTPVLHFRPPDGVAFFGPVISRHPGEEHALKLWDHVVGLASFPGFAELKRSLRELPQLPALGVRAGEVGAQEDWHAGSRRPKK